MQTNLTDLIKATHEGREADTILRTCVHCGFCLAACPTYQLLDDELDSPRGRIYLMKEVLEGKVTTQKTQLHLDRCLTCRACETICPSGVRYGRLLDICRNIVEKKVERSIRDKIIRYTLRQILPSSGIFMVVLKIGQTVRSLLPKRIQNSVPSKARNAGTWPSARHKRKMLALDGCVQPAIAPNINAATARILDKIGISLIRVEKANCCGAISYHLNAQQEGLDYMRRNIDAWWPYFDKDGGHEVEAIVMTASGCGVTVKEYGHYLSHDHIYAKKAARISELTKDISEILENEAEKLTPLFDNTKSRTERSKIAFHSPCTLQHGFQIHGLVENILTTAGFDLTLVQDSHICCGSAGTYSILQPQLSKQLLENKIKALESSKPTQIVTANIGCLTHLQSGTPLIIKHWIEVLDEKLLSH
jgi:glycolate dehydrogenase iron-sulfur subunit